LNCYTYSVVCPDCHAAWYVDHILLSLPLRCADTCRCVCPRCLLGIILPYRVEAMLLGGLADDQTDVFGNPSPFLTSLAREIKQHAGSSRPYALVTIPEIEITCPNDGTILKAWLNYPEDPPLVCPKCGSCSCRGTYTGWFGCLAPTDW
jgi:hypothetical protein